jgi:hypothetical protein
MASPSRLLIQTCFAAMLTASAAYAGPTTDFSTIPGTNPIGSTASLDGVTIKAFINGFTTPSQLWKRTDGPTEDGLGVCSEGTSACTTGGGDINEVSNQSPNTEWLVLNRPATDMWSGVWISSLDFNGTGHAESGTIYWSNTLGDLSNSLTFDASEFPGANGNLFTLLTAAGFDPFASFLMFTSTATANNPNNNDYLVWGVDLTSCLNLPGGCPGVTGFPSPEPLTLSVFGAGLAGAAFLRRRKKKSV